MTDTTTKLVSFGNYIFPDIQGNYNDNFRNVVTKTSRLAGVDGGYDEYGNAPAPTEVGNVSFRFTLVAESRGEMAEKRDALGMLTSLGKQRLVARPGDEEPRYCIARVNNTGYPLSLDEHTDLFLPVSMNFQATEPFWNAVGTETNKWGQFAWGAGDWGAGGIAQAASGAATSYTLNVGGNAPTFPRIQIKTAAGQTASNIYVQRIVNGYVHDEIRWLPALPANSLLEVNTRALTVKLNGANAYNANFQYLDASFFRLMPGSNAIRILMAAGTNACTVTFFYFERFRNI